MNFIFSCSPDEIEAQITARQASTPVTIDFGAGYLFLTTEQAHGLYADISAVLQSLEAITEIQADA